MTTTLREFEGLVISTSRMWSGQVHREEEDVAQELRVRVWRACVTWRPDRGSTLRAYVYMVVANKVKDLKRDAAREVRRRDDAGVSFGYIEDMRLFDDSTITAQERFDALYNHVTHDQAYAEVERETFELPTSISDREGRVLVLLVYGFGRSEIALRLSESRSRVDADIRSLRHKLADWKPSASVALLALELAA